MWWHADNSSYGWLLQGFATADTIAGPYTFVNATAPLGNWSQDFGMFTDYKDGKTYSLYSNGDRKEGRDVYLTSFNEDITDLDEVIHRWDKFDLEAPTIIQTEKSYYALMSHKTGYRPNSEPERMDMTILTDLFGRRCCLPRRFSCRSLVSALHRFAPEYQNFQLSVWILIENCWRKENDVSLPWRPGT